jgi:hypothetical protein
MGDEVQICMFYLGEHPKVCEKCKTLNNQNNNTCIQCEEKLK